MEPGTICLKEWSPALPDDPDRSVVDHVRSLLAWNVVTGMYRGWIGTVYDVSGRPALDLDSYRHPLSSHGRRDPGTRYSSLRMGSPAVPDHLDHGVVDRVRSL